MGDPIEGIALRYLWGSTTLITLSIYHDSAATTNTVLHGIATVGARGGRAHNDATSHVHNSYKRGQCPLEPKHKVLAAS